MSDTTALGCPRPVGAECEYPTCVEKGHCEAGPYPGSDKSQNTHLDLDDDAIDAASMAIWEEYPAPLPAWASIPELALESVSRGDLRRMARAAVRAYLNNQK